MSVRNFEVFLQTYLDVMDGHVVRPRGQECRERLDYSFVLDMNDNPLTSFKARNLNLRYAKEEFKWYLGADRFDSTIEKYATMWQKIRQPDGSYFSNYGQYIFPLQFDFVVNELTRDPDSRRACMVLLKPEHLFHENKDVVCTYALWFAIRNGFLHMSVMMRSNDVIFGTTNDVFCFAMLYRMVFAMVRENVAIRIGTYRHTVNSLHVYARHYGMIEAIVNDGVSGYEEVAIPWPDVDEVKATLKHQYMSGNGDWSEWLK